MGKLPRNIWDKTIEWKHVMTFKFGDGWSADVKIEEKPAKKKVKKFGVAIRVLDI